MFGYTFKNIPAEYIFAGYNVRKSLSVMTSNENGKIVYDTFLYTYVDNYLSFYLLMDNGMYKNIDEKVEVPLINAEELMSKHLARGKLEDTEEYENYSKDKIIGVFGIRDMETLMKQVDTMAKENNLNEMSLEAMLDVKKQYMGMEVTGTINKFNSLLNYPKGTICIPAITYGQDDPFKSLIGDEMDFFDFMSNKDSDTIIKDFKKLDDSLDGIGNVKDGKSVNIVKNEEEGSSQLEIKDNN